MNQSGDILSATARKMPKSPDGTTSVETLFPSGLSASGRSLLDYDSPGTMSDALNPNKVLPLLCHAAQDILCGPRAIDNHTQALPPFIRSRASFDLVKV